jgi:hydrogenase maturation protein HypF
MWRSLFEDLANQVLPEIISAKFHQCVIQAVVQVALQLSRRHHLKTIALSGGVFQNKLLLEGISKKLKKHQLSVISPQLLPMNDAGLSAGQAAIALCRQ